MSRRFSLRLHRLPLSCPLLLSQCRRRGAMAATGLALCRTRRVAARESAVRDATDIGSSVHGPCRRKALLLAQGRRPNVLDGCYSIRMTTQQRDLHLESVGFSYLPAAGPVAGFGETRLEVAACDTNPRLPVAVATDIPRRSIRLIMDGAAADDYHR